MRIIAGRLGGRTFQSPRSFKTHPMSDKVRGALFNMLGDIEGLHVLDAFAGSGALSFEAVSRGAAHATAIDNDRAAQTIIASNSKELGLQDQVSLIKAGAGAWLQTSASSQFDIVLCDPPYNDTQINLVRRLAVRVAPNGIMVVSWPGAVDAPEIPGFKKVAHRSYGDAQLIFYSR
ncbi:MAG TPA: 16S rRNA (guanine(966)-N(2))-methyltransferase RsmD [Candidatus Saccharimonadales bacterium]